MSDAYLDGITPRKISDYAQYSGWERIEVDIEDCDVEILRDDTGREIWLPLTEDVRDYESRIDESVELLAESEGRDKKSVADEIVQSASDIIRFGVFSAVTGLGTIPLAEGIEFYRQAMKLLEASANEVLRPGQRSFQGSDKRVQQYINACRIGTSEEGSYIGKIISPIHIDVDHELEDQELEDQDAAETFPRKTTQRLMRAINVALRHIDERDFERLLQPEDERVQVSSNLCEAIAAMLEMRGRPKIRIEFSHTKTAPAANIDVHSVEIDQRYLNPLKRVARELKSIDKLIEATFSGHVKSLNGKENLQGEMQGLVWLLLDVYEVGEATASIPLGPENYETAGIAHIQNRAVKVRGTLRLKDRKDKLHSFEAYTSFGFS